VVVVRCWDERRRAPCRGDLPDGATGASNDEVSRGKRSPEVVGERKQPVLASGDPLPESGVVRVRGAERERGIVALAGQMQHGRTRGGECLERSLVEPLRALAATEDEDDGALLRKLEAAASVDRVARLRARRDRPAYDLVLRRLESLYRIGEEPDPRATRRQAGRQGEECSCLRQGGGNPHASGGEHHRPRDVAAPAE